MSKKIKFISKVHFFIRIILNVLKFINKFLYSIINNLNIKKLYYFSINCKLNKKLCNYIYFFRIILFFKFYSLEII